MTRNFLTENQPIESNPSNEAEATSTEQQAGADKATAPASPKPRNALAEAFPAWDLVPTVNFVRRIRS
jgi:hypothetical protein